MRKLQIAVLGASKAICTKKMYTYAERAGELLAQKDCIVLTGGGLGVMEAAMKGAKKYGGLTLAVLPWEDHYHVNEYADVVVATGIGWSRDAINLNSCDGALVVGGGAGTLNEVTYAYLAAKPTVCITPSGGMAKQISDSYFDVRKTVKIHGAKNAEEAVEKLLKLIEKKPYKASEHDLELLDSENRQNWKVSRNPRTKTKVKKKATKKK